MFNFTNFKKVGVVGSAVGLALLTVAGTALADHSWGGYHWARTSNPFTVKLGDNVGMNWDAYLAEASSDWSASAVLDASVVSGSTKPQSCKPKSGRVEVCNSKYGVNGWLGIAQIWITNGNHITQGVAKMNDTYFNTPTYNTPAWRRFVMCQEVAHTFGLDHQDEAFDNANLGSCMDYTNDPDGGLGGAASDDPSNEHPNAHDFEELETIYAHLDGFTTLASGGTSNGRGNSAQAAVLESGNASEWGVALRRDAQGSPSLYGKDLGNGQKLFTFVIWARQ